MKTHGKKPPSPLAHAPDELTYSLTILKNCIFARSTGQRTIAHKLGISRLAFRNWLTGTAPVPPARQENLIRVLLDQLGPVADAINTLSNYAKAGTPAPAKVNLLVKASREGAIARDNGTGSLIKPL